MGKIIKKTAIVLAIVLGALVLLCGGYALYVVIQYHRIEDKLPLTAENNEKAAVPAGEELSALSYNIGFGAYEPSFSFFMDSGTMKSGEKVRGRYAKAKDRATAEKNTAGAAALAAEQNADFYLFQEVDTSGTRSRGVNQYAALTETFADYSRTFAVNFHSAFLLYPFNDPIGKNDSGVATFSAYRIESAERRQYPVDTGFNKFFDLDRCFSVHRLPTDNGKQLVLVNSHMSAYDEGGLIRQKQLALLNEVLAAEYAAGNYVVVGGDFNHALAGSIDAFPTEQEIPEWVFELVDGDLAEGFSFAAATNAPTCRSTDMPYRKGVNYTVVLDGFIVSDNVETVKTENIDNDFAFSDHQPAKLVFRLK
ncbi:MAG: endonuclease [Bacillota bacterium]|nr:MAG: endonuclease [Bacillota bacterium]